MTDNMRSAPSSAMDKWLGDLPSPGELGPNEHFAIGEYDDEKGYRRSALFVYESVGKQQHITNRHSEWMHPRTPPLPPNVPVTAFNPFDFAPSQPANTKPAIENAEQQPSFKITALNSVESGKIILKRFAKTAGNTLDKIAVMPDYANSGFPTFRRRHPSISTPLQNKGNKVAFSTISIEEAQTRDKARRSDFQQQTAKKAISQPLERRQIGHADRQTNFGDFITYRTPEEEAVPPSNLSPPRIPEHINRPKRRPLPPRAPTLDLNKSLPSSPSTDSLRRRTQIPPNVKSVSQPDIFAVPEMKAVVKIHRNAIVSQYGLVFGDSGEFEGEQEEGKEISWPGTPANFDPEELGNKPLCWWQFESSVEELDPTQVVWARMEESLRCGGGIREASGSADGGASRGGRQRRGS